MLGKCFFIICIISAIASVCMGNVSALSDAVLEGAARGVALTLSMAGMMCLWCGIMEVFKQAGALEKLSRLLSPLLKRIFPRAFSTGIGKDEIIAAVSANMLGISSAATPFALKAMEKLDAVNDAPHLASDDMVTLAVLGCSSISLFPTTVITLRHSAGAAAPYSVVVPIWICSALCTASALLLCRLTRRNGKKSGRKV